MCEEDYKGNHRDNYNYVALLIDNDRSNKTL